jgi:hypothetical protein
VAFPRISSLRSGEPLLPSPPSCRLTSRNLDCLASIGSLLAEHSPHWYLGITMVLLVPFVFTIIALCFRVAIALACYDPSGKSLQGRDGWGNALLNVCTTGPISWCCSTYDYCLSNGLCFDDGSDNGLLQQGCTSQAWGAPCVKYCNGIALISTSLKTL